MQDTNEELYYTRQHIANLLGVSTSTIIRWQKDGLPVEYIGPGELPRYKFADVYKWVHSKDRKGIKNG